MAQHYINPILKLHIRAKYHVGLFENRSCISTKMIPIDQTVHLEMFCMQTHSLVFALGLPY